MQQEYIRHLLNIYEEEEEEEEYSADIDEETQKDEGRDEESPDSEEDDNVEDPYADLSPEELREALKEKEQKIQKIVGDLRKKEKKQLSDKVDATENNSEEDSDKTVDPNQELLARLEQLEQQIQQGTQTKQATQAEALEQLWDSPLGERYAPENDIDGKNIAELQKAYKELEGKYPSDTLEEKVALFKRAHFVAFPEAIEERPKIERKPNAADAGNIGGSSERGGNSQRLTQRQIELAQKFGNDPSIVYKQ